MIRHGAILNAYYFVKEASEKSSYGMIETTWPPGKSKTIEIVEKKRVVAGV